VGVKHYLSGRCVFCFAIGDGGDVATAAMLSLALRRYCLETALKGWEPSPFRIGRDQSTESSAEGHYHAYRDIHLDFL